MEWLGGMMECVRWDDEEEMERRWRGVLREEGMEWVDGCRPPRSMSMKATRSLSTVS
jgi:hypothetical protein